MDIEENSVYNFFKKEREILENYKKIKPYFFIPPQISERELFDLIGIKFQFPPRLKGYIRLYFQDFIVEEILNDQQISEIESREIKELPPSFSSFTLFVNLIKIGISTNEAVLYLAKYLKIKPDKIHHAGLKDVKAITSQKIAFPNINLEILEKIKKFSSPNFFLTNFSFSKGTIQPGQLFGNRFTIFIRTEKEIDEKWIDEQLKKTEKEGFLNFYQTQRFGTPRFLSHLLGKLILQGNYKEAVLNFFFRSGLKEIPLIKKIREETQGLFPNWERIEKVFKKLPYTFRNELRLISYFKEHPKNFIGALIFFKDQTTLWIYAYTSYLFNLLLSLNKRIELPEKIPLLLSNLPKDWEIYKFWLKQDEIENFQSSIKPFPFIILKRRLVKTKIFPEKILFKVLPEGLILHFALEKGVYATTFLMNFFEIEIGEPIPNWVKTNERDIKKEIGIGSMEKIKEILGKDIFIPDFNQI